ncbi:hypothetical protein MHBO_004996 [Bonamia ostreae]|uniref:Uncharacterized protein n=1 Tax=Bonamia ostreae TaxID=126728 RepID=A0ABV2AVG4_9EUKA
MLSDWSGRREFSGFREEQSSPRKLATVERELRVTKELISRIMEKEDELIKDSIELKIYKEYQSAQKENNEIKHSVEELKKENETLKSKCSD